MNPEVYCLPDGEIVLVDKITSQNEYEYGTRDDAHKYVLIDGTAVIMSLSVHPKNIFPLIKCGEL